MGYVLPGWLDEILDYIGIKFPNVDEDDYREMADAMREFADKFEGHGADAHKAVERILASSKGWAVHSMQTHWAQVKAGHLDKIPELARLFAEACDVVADIIFGMKTKAEAELAVMAGSVGLSLGMAFVTGGLSAVLGAAEVTAMRQLVKRIIDEAADRCVDELIARVTAPVNAKLEAMVEDAVLNLANDAFSLPPEPTVAGGGGGARGNSHGHGGMQLASAGGAGGGFMLASAGGGGGGGADLFIDHEEFESGAGKVSAHGSALHLASSSPLDRAKGAFGRTKGKDAFSRAFDSVLEGALHGSEKALKKIVKHVTETVPDRVRAASRLHKHNDHGVRDKIDSIRLGKGGDGHGNSHDLGGLGRGRRTRTRPDSLQGAASDPRRNAIPLTKKRCENDPVDVATGEMTLSDTDVALVGVLPLVLRRTHRSEYRYGRWFGRSWASTLDERIELTGSGAIWAREDGSLLVFPQLPNENDAEGVLPSEGPRLTLTFESRHDATTTYRITDPASGVTRLFTGSPYHPSSAYWLTRIENRSSVGITIERQSDGAPSAVVHEGGYVVLVTMADDRVGELSLRTPSGPKTVRRFGYDQHGNLETVVNSSGLPLRFTYDEDARITSWTDRNDCTFRYAYDEQGRVVQTVGPDGFLSSSFAYTRHPDTGDRITRYTDSTGAQRVFHITSRLQVAAETDPLGHTTRFVFDARDRLLEHTDALGNTTRLERDDDGNLVGLIAADGVRTTATFNEFGLPVTVTERGGRTRRYEYDARGNLTAVTEPDGSRTEYETDEYGHVTAIRDAAGGVTGIRTNSAGLLVSITAPDGARATFVRDAFGRVTEATDALGGSLRQGWTVEGKPAWRELPDGTREEWSWDGEGNLVSHTDRSGRTSTHTVTHFDRPSATQASDGGHYRFTHDTELRLTTVTNAHGLEWHYSYDAAGRLMSETDFDGRTVTYEHDPLGRLRRRTNAAGQSLTYERDLMGRVVSLRHDDGATSTFTRDVTGHVVQITNPHARIDLERDLRGRIVAESVNGNTLTRAYDALGRPTRRRTPSGATGVLTYDDRGLAAYTAGEHTFRFERDALGREIARTLDDALTLQQGWDAVGRLVSQSLAGAHKTLLERSFTYRADGTPATVEDSLTGRRTYSVDEAGRITAVSARGWSERYAYNAAGDQTRTALPAGAPGQDSTGDRDYAGSRVTRAGRTHYEYDAQGRLVRRRTTTLSGKTLTWTFTWDAEDRLTHLEAPGDCHWRYLYDALGRRIAKQRLDAQGRITDATTFCWDGAQLAEQQSNGITLVWDYAGLRPLAQRESKAGLTQEETDRRFFAIVTELSGAPAELVAPDGSLAWRGRSTAWGATQSHRSATAYTPLRYPGQYFDPESGLHYNVNRYYDPDLGRYATPDPLGLAPAINHYAYVPNPLTLTDPLGLAGCDADPTWGGRVNWTLDEHGRPYEMNSVLTRDMLDEGTEANPSIRPPGFLGGAYNQARGHMLARMLGGSGDHPDNLFAITQNPTNSPEMRDWEQDMYDAVRKGEVVHYNVYLEYTDDLKDSVPKYIQLEAHGHRGFSLDVSLKNPAHAQQQLHRQGLL
ncbi:RHS repeat-associated core domain-containing protein [Streptomyces sp. NPDC046759]|uniref:RHS repeat-associated core domain-containing protein n=1 Tax=Streptomyces sp. NPDC046759 TaxID=3155019 RepID=UPI0033D98E87